MKTSKILFSVAILSTVFTSCKKDNDPVANPDGTFPTSIELGGNQNDPLTLTDHITDPNVPDYCITSDYSVKAAVVVEPGVTIQMKDDTRIFVNANGSFKCVGTANSKITIKGEAALTAGQWQNIHFATNNVDNQLVHTNVSGGGDDGTYEAMVFIGWTGNALIDNCKIHFSSTNGIKTESATTNLGGISNCDISVCTLYPMDINSRLIHHVASSNTGAGNGNEMINIGSSQIQNTMSWPKSNFAFRISSNLSIAADVTVAPGARFRIEPNAKIDVGTNGSFNCVGTATEKIRFFGTSNAPGAWQCVNFYATHSPLNRFEHCEFEYGGGSSSHVGMITLFTNATVRIGNSSFENSARWGVFYAASSCTLVDDGNNTFSGNALGSIGF